MPKMINRYNDKGKFLERTEMKIADVKKYFNSLAKGKEKTIKTPGSYCERCGINIGEKFENTKGYDYKNFYICLTCLKHKKLKQKENTPDIEDIERFKVYQI